MLAQIFNEASICFSSQTASRRWMSKHEHEDSRHLNPNSHVAVGRLSPGDIGYPDIGAFDFSRVTHRRNR